MISVDYEQVVYAGNGSQDAWPYSFPIYGGDVIRLILIDTDGTEINIEQDYFVDVPGSTVYYPGYAPGEEPPVADQPPKVQSGQKLIVYRDTEITQDSDLGDSWPFNVIEKGLDKLTMILQEKAFALARCLKISQGQAAEIDNYDPTVPLAADKVICGNAAGDGFEAREALMEVNGAWDGEGRQIHSVADPTGDQDAATKNYVDTLTDNNFMKLQPDGTAWEGRNLSISNVAGPALVRDAANKDYVDRILAGYSGQGDRFVFFDNVAQMQAADLVPSQMAVTLGYYDVNDGGAGVYTIRDIGADTPDGGSIIEIPDTDYVAELITDGTVKVKQFGGYGDGVANDTQALQNCINYAKTKDLAVIIDGKFYITDTIVVPAQSRILGLASVYTYGSYIYVSSSCSLAFDMSAGQVYMENVVIQALNSTYAGSTDGVYLIGNNYNADSTFKNVSFNYLRKGAIVCGRSVAFRQCGFSHCQYGINYDFDDSIQQIRGLIVDGCYFHGIGEEAALNWFENSYAIYFTKSIWSQLSVLNCTCNQGGCFLYGYGGDFQIENNFIESFKITPIQIGKDLTAPGNPAQNGTVLIQGNIIRGKNGSVALDVTVDYPDHAIEVNYFGRVVISNNTISKFAHEGIKVSNAKTYIYGNSVQSVGWDDADKVFLKTDNANLFVCDNLNISGVTMYLANAVSATTVSQCLDNYEIGSNSTYSTNLTFVGGWIQVASIKANDPVTYTLPVDFYLTFTDSSNFVTFHCCKVGSFFSSGHYRANSTTTYELYWEIDSDNNLVPKVFKDESGTITTGTWWMNVYLKNF